MKRRKRDEKYNPKTRRKNSQGEDPRTSSFWEQGDRKWR